MQNFVYKCVEIFMHIHIYLMFILLPWNIYFPKLILNFKNKEADFRGAQRN